MPQIGRYYVSNLDSYKDFTERLKLPVGAGSTRLIGSTMPMVLTSARFDMGTLPQTLCNVVCGPIQRTD